MRHGKTHDAEPRQHVAQDSISHSWKLVRRGFSKKDGHEQQQEVASKKHAETDGKASGFDLRLLPEVDEEKEVDAHKGK